MNMLISQICNKVNGFLQKLSFNLNKFCKIILNHKEII